MSNIDDKKRWQIRFELSDQLRWQLREAAAKKRMTVQAVLSEAVESWVHNQGRGER
jgi:hypothetical protein